MASQEVALYKALEALGAVVVFREERDQLAFADAIATLRPSDEELERAEAGAAPDAAAEAAAEEDERTFGELYERAQELEIAGRSSMSKAELIAAVDAAEQE